MDQQRLEMTELMTPDLANFSGKVHGGALLNLLDRVAFSCASRFSRRYTVTLSVDQVTFKQPISVGELVTFLASVNNVGRTSMEVGIRVEAENIRTGVRRHTNSCYFTMVALDDDGKACLMTSLGSFAIKEPLPGTAYMPGSGGGRIEGNQVLHHRGVV